MGRCPRRVRTDVIHIGVEKFMIECSHFLVGQPAERPEHSAGCVERQGPVQHHPMLCGIVFRCVSLQVLEFQRHEVVGDLAQKPRGETKRAGLRNQSQPRTAGLVGGRCLRRRSAISSDPHRRDQPADKNGNPEPAPSLMSIHAILSPQRGSMSRGKRGRPHPGTVRAWTASIRCSCHTR